MVVDKLTEKLEALLFASGSAMEVAKLTDIVGEKYKRNVIKALEKIRESYDKRKSPVMVVELDGLWKLTVREEFLPLVRRIVSDMELPKSVLETLAVIAWKTPLMQSQLIKVRTNKAYEHIDLLERLGFINKTKAGRSYRLALAEKFYEYFDVQGGNIKSAFKDVKGIEEELEMEHQKHLDELTNNDSESKITATTTKESNVEEIQIAMEADAPHLGGLEVVDSISEDVPEGIEIVDELSVDEVQDEVDIEESDSIEEKSSKKSRIKDLSSSIEETDDDDDESDAPVEEVEEIIEELDEEEKAKEDIEEILDEAIGEEEKKD